MKVGEKYIIEISDVIATINGNIAKIKGFNALVFDENGLNKLTKTDIDPEFFTNEGIVESLNNAQQHGYKRGYDKGYDEGYTKGREDVIKEAAETPFVNNDLSKVIEDNYKKGYDKGFKDGVKYQESMMPPKAETHEPKEGDVYFSELGILAIITHKGECGYAVLWEDGTTGHYSADKIKKWKLVSSINVFLNKLKREALA